MFLMENHFWKIIDKFS